MIHSKRDKGGDNMDDKKLIKLLKRKIELLEEGICSNSCLGTDIENELKRIDKEIKR